MMTTPPSPWLDLAGAATYLLVSQGTILRAARKRELTGYRVSGRKCWRFRREDLDAWAMRANTPVLASSEPARSRLIAAVPPARRSSIRGESR